MLKEPAELRSLRIAVDKCRLNLDGATRGDSQIAATCRPLVASCFAAFDAVADLSMNATARLAPAASDPTLSPAGRRDKLAAISSQLAIEASTQLVAIGTASKQILAAVDKLVATPKPSSIDDAALSARKSDLLLVLDRIANATDVVSRLARFAADALADGDELTAWLVMRTDWPALLLESRGDELYVTMLNDEIGRIASQRADMAGGEEAAARHIAMAARGAYGLDTLAQAASMWWHLTSRSLPAFIASAAPAV